MRGPKRLAKLINYRRLRKYYQEVSVSDLIFKQYLYSRFEVFYIIAGLSIDAYRMTSAPSVADIRALRALLGASLWTTPVLRCAGLEDLLQSGTEIYGKCEFLQRTGTFKARGALANLSCLDARQRRLGVTAVSAGNHAVATAFAARAVGSSAKVVMTKTANAARVDACRGYGGEVVFAETVHEAFAMADKIQADEGRHLVHPYEGPQVAAGTGMIGLEMHEQCANFDVVVVAVGGGGLLGGIANAIKQLRPECEVIGVEPEGADSMHRSFKAGKPEAIDAVKTIADSLGAPYAMPYSFELCRNNVDSLTLVSDEQIRRAMGILFKTMKIAVEPACAATTAALLGPLREIVAGRNVMQVFCGSNIDWPTFIGQVEPGYPYAA